MTKNEFLTNTIRDLLSSRRVCQFTIDVTGNLDLKENEL